MSHVRYGHEVSAGKILKRGKKWNKNKSISETRSVRRKVKLTVRKIANYYAKRRK